MDYRCEDLPQHGVVLIPSSSPDFPALLENIQTRAANRQPGWAPEMPAFEDPSAPAMILVDHSKVAIAAVAWIWKIEFDTGRPTGFRVSRHGGTSPLMPFGLDDSTRKLYGHWHTSLPGSKRAIRGASMIGDNTDVRPPEPDELWKGGMIAGGGRSRYRTGAPASITLSLDGMFFLDGGFAGPGTLHTFEWMSADIAAHLQVAHIARDGHNHGLPTAEIFGQIEAITGPERGPAMPSSRRATDIDYRQSSLQNMASQIASMRRIQSDDQVIYQLMS